MTRKKRARSRSSFGSFDDAAPAMLARIANGESIPTVAASMVRALETTQEALERRLRRRVAIGEGIADERRIVSVEHEQMILGLIKAFASFNKPLRPSEVIALARENAQYGDFDQRKWFANFMARHKNFIVVRKDKTITAARISPKIIDDIEHYIIGYDSLRRAHPIGPRGIMSLDEFLLSFNGDVTGAEVIEWVKRRRKATQTPRTSRIGSICFVTSAEGCVVAKFVILRAGHRGERTGAVDVVLPAERRLRRHETTNLWYITSESGCMDNEIFALIADKLLELKRSGMDHIGVDLDRHLRFDGLDQHLQLDVLSKLVAGHIHPVILPPNTSAFTAVEDDQFFGVLRRELNKYVQSFIGEATTREAQVAVIWRALEVAEARADAPSVIRAAYRNVGAHPWNPDVVRRNARRVTGAELPHSRLEPPLVRPFRGPGGPRRARAAPRRCLSAEPDRSRARQEAPAHV
jgi:hypothetical protein